MPTPSSRFECLGLTSAQTVEAVRSVGGSGPLAMEAYRRMFREGLREHWRLAVDLPPVVRQLREDSDEGPVVKFLCALPEEASGPLSGRTLETESVLIPMIGSSGRSTYTLCLSSQVGCAMGCGFCETAQMGLIRSLSAREIVAQWFTATHVIGIRPKNIVFMGMGEPLDNFDAVMQAIDVLKDHNGAAAPISNITVSTVGKLDGIRRMRSQISKDGWHRLNLALSLNASNDAVRSELMPVNRRWNLEELQRELVNWPRFAGNKLCIEYVLIPGVNDSRSHASEIAAFLRPLVAQVRRGATGDPSLDTRLRAVLNLIPYNPRRNSPWPAPTEEAVDQFMGWLIEERVFVKRRRTKGRRMMGACGQLGNEEIRARRLIPVTSSAPRAGGTFL